MRASYWLLGLLLFLFFPRQSFKQNTLKSLFFSREHQLVYL